MNAMTDERASVWKWAVWFAMVACLGQAMLVEAVRVTTNRLIFLGPDYIWMALVANVVLFAAAALVVEIIDRLLPATRRVKWSLWAFLFLTMIGPMFLYRGLHKLTGIALAAGVAVQGAAFLNTHRGGFDRIVRRTFWVLLGLNLASGFGVKLSRDVLARQTLSSSATVPAGAPNVILIVLDTVRAQNLGLYGYPRETSPWLDRFARSGVTFERAFSTAPWTLPSHATLFTGRSPHELSADWLMPLDDKALTLSEVFDAQGYRTAGFVGNLLYCTTESGLSRGFNHYDSSPVSWPMILKSSWLTRGITFETFGMADGRLRKHANQVNAEFLDWLSRPSNKPFFVFLNYFDAHFPYRTPPPYDTKFGHGGPPLDLSDRQTWSAEEIQYVVDGYDSSIAYLDQQLGELFDALSARGTLDNTLVIVTADHGDQFGEHGLIGHGNSLYRTLLQVPLVISFKGRVPEGVRVAESVSLADLPATILDLTRMAGAPLPGQSLTAAWQTDHADSRSMQALLSEVTKGIQVPLWEPVAKGSMKSVIVGGLHYIRGGDGREELYDVERDSAEANDLSNRPESREALDQSRRALDALLK